MIGRMIGRIHSTEGRHGKCPEHVDHCFSKMGLGKLFGTQMLWLNICCFVLNALFVMVWLFFFTDVILVKSPATSYCFYFTKIL